jgi:carbonic anhydrase/acetyltransferase-like protein (isoleucine patch superfamily)
MNIITKKAISSLGYGFIPKEFIPKGKNEYYLRNIQHRSGIRYRKLTAVEIQLLEKNDNSSDDWNKVLVSESFDPLLVKRCSFFGLVRIGKLEPYFHEFNNLHMPVGIYNSTIISCDIGDNVVIDNVSFMSHYIIGNDVMLVNINELATTNHSKFGNGVLKEGEKEAVRVWMEICNENGGRSVLPFNDMQAGDAWLWSKYRDDEKLLQQFREFTDKKFDTRRGYYGKIGDRTVIKNCKIVKDTWIGSDAYLKGANKIKNITINSSPEAKSQIGEGCELVNGIVGFGCRIFYGVKAVRFMMGTNSQLKYGARLINSYLGDNSTISCCEVLNSLIFPAHEQHHNNSFLCAAVVQGQSNMAAGATIGSNHNSRGADGEIIAGRGFWPGLCVSLKHNSKFASFTLIAKGDFPAELNIPIPFSLVSNDVSRDKLVIMPGYWFMYNMYALARNAGKYTSRDKRLDKSQVIEYDFLAPDSIQEMFESLPVFKTAVAKAWALKNKKTLAEKDLLKKGEELLEKNPEALEGLEILAEGFENTPRKTQLVKVPEAYRLYKELITYYGTMQLIRLIESTGVSDWKQLQPKLPGNAKRTDWKNIGGQLIPEPAIQSLIRSVRQGKINDWDEVHAFYKKESTAYPVKKFQQSFAALLEIQKLSVSRFTRKTLVRLLGESIRTKEWMTTGIYESRAKDYRNPFRKMVYDTEAEMEKVIGKLKDNSFILQQQEELKAFRKQVTELIRLFSK